MIVGRQSALMDGHTATHEDNGGRRSGRDLRRFTYSEHIPERRANPERRSGVDRRNGSDRRKGMDRRSGADRRRLGKDPKRIEMRIGEDRRCGLDRRGGVQRRSAAN
jgi:hypothetical protein